MLNKSFIMQLFIMNLQLCLTFITLTLMITFNT